MINFANILTIARIIAIPPLVLLMLSPLPMAGWAAVTLYICIALTDWLDGWVARNFDQMSEFGRFLDPIADKILVAAMFIALVANHIIDGWWLTLPIIILTREFLVSGLREFLGPKGAVVHVSKLAKWKTTAQMIALAVLTAVPVFPGALMGGLLLLLLATGLTVVTGWDYLRGARGHFN